MIFINALKNLIENILYLVLLLQLSNEKSYY